MANVFLDPDNWARGWRGEGRQGWGGWGPALEASGAQAGGAAPPAPPPSPSPHREGTVPPRRRCPWGGGGGSVCRRCGWGVKWGALSEKSPCFLDCVQGGGPARPPGKPHAETQGGRVQGQEAAAWWSRAPSLRFVSPCRCALALPGRWQVEGCLQGALPPGGLACQRGPHLEPHGEHAQAPRFPPSKTAGVMQAGAKGLLGRVPSLMSPSNRGCSSPPMVPSITWADSAESLQLPSSQGWCHPGAGRRPRSLVSPSLCAPQKPRRNLKTKPNQNERISRPPAQRSWVSISEEGPWKPVLSTRCQGERNGTSLLAPL